jgi:RecA-family ATPase
MQQAIETVPILLLEPQQQLQQRNAATVMMMLKIFAQRQAITNALPLVRKQQMLCHFQKTISKARPRHYWKKQKSKTITD